MRFQFGLGLIFIVTFCLQGFAQHPMGTTNPKLKPQVAEFDGYDEGKDPKKKETQDVNNPPTREMKFKPIKSSSEITVNEPKKAAGLRSNLQTRVVKQKEERATATKSYNQSGASATMDAKKKALLRVNQGRQTGAYAPASVLKAVQKNTRASEANQAGYSGTKPNNRYEGIYKSTMAQKNYQGNTKDWVIYIEDVNEISNRRQSKYMPKTTNKYQGPSHLASPEKRATYQRKTDAEQGSYAGAGQYVSLEEKKKLTRQKDQQSGLFDGKLEGDLLQRKKQNTAEHEIQTALYDDAVLGKYLDNREKMRRMKDKEQADNQGALKGDLLAQRAELRRLKDKEQGTNTGDIRGNYLARRDAMRRSKDKEQANNSGDIGGNYLATREAMRRAKDKEQANNSGDIGGNYLANREKMRRMKDKEQANNTGDIPLNYLLARNQMRRAKDKEQANYRGDILVSDLYERERSIRKKSKQIANWQGDIVVTYKKKGMHPSAVYQGGKVQNSYEAKEKLRKQVLKRYGKSKDFEIPNYEKRKDQKPTYDPKEAEIWY